MSGYGTLISHIEILMPTYNGIICSAKSHIGKVLREFDDESIDVMFSESFDDSGIGQAIMNRLLKAAGHCVIRL